MVSDGAPLANTSSQATALAAGRSNDAAAEAEPRGFLGKMKGIADGINKMAEDSVANMASLTERILAKVTPGVAAAGRDITEISQQSMHDFGERFEERHEFKQWEEGAKERFPETLQTIEQTGEVVQAMAPLTAAGLIPEAEATQGFLSPTAQASSSSRPQVDSAAVRGPVVSQAEASASKDKHASGNAADGVNAEADISNVQVDVVEEGDEKKEERSEVAKPVGADTDKVEQEITSLAKSSAANVSTKAGADAEKTAETEGSEATEKHSALMRTEEKELEKEH